MQDKKKNIGHLFDNIAASYDTLNHLLSLKIDKSWRKKSAGMLLPCDKLLDVAIGTVPVYVEISDVFMDITVNGNKYTHNL